MAPDGLVWVWNERPKGGVGMTDQAGPNTLPARQTSREPESSGLKLSLRKFGFSYYLMGIL